MTLSTITINSIIYTVYATRTEVNEYLAVDPVRMAAWAALADTDDARGPYIVAATRRLDMLTWEGEKTGGATQENAWYRTGADYEDGTAVGDAELPLEVQNATSLLSGSILIDPTVSQEGTSTNNTKRAKAGPVESENFRFQQGVQLQDTSAYDLIKQFLASDAVSASTGPLASGTGGSSTFSNIDQWGRDRGFP